MSELHLKFGELLRLEREHQGVALEIISSELKIPEETLKHLEAGEVSALPAELYFTLFSRSYAEFLGIDYAKTIEAMREELGEALEPDLPPDERQKEHKRKGTVSAASGRGEPDVGAFLKKAGIIAGVIVGAFIIFLVGYFVLFANGTGTGAPGGSTYEETDARGDDGSGPEGGDRYDWNVPTYQPPDSIRLTLIAREESWATVYSDGTQALYRTISPGRAYAIAAKYRLVVSIGIPRVVDVQLDGQPAFLADPETGRINRVEVDQTNRDRFLAPRERRPSETVAPAETPGTPEAPDSVPVTNEAGTL